MSTTNIFLAVVATFGLLVVVGALVYGLRRHGIRQVIGPPNPIAVVAAIALFFFGTGSIWERISQFWWVSLLVIGLSTLIHRPTQSFVREQVVPTLVPKEPPLAKRMSGIQLVTIMAIGFIAIAVAVQVLVEPAHGSWQQVAVFTGLIAGVGLLIKAFGEAFRDR